MQVDPNNNQNCSNSYPANLNILAIIPARMASSRFPGKPMAKIHKIPMIGHVYLRTRMCSLLSETYVATCDQEIYDYIHSIGGKAVMTDDTHERCSDRTSEAMIKIESEIKRKVDIVVMVQGDEPMVTPEMIEKSIVPMLEDSSVIVVNLMAQINTIEEFEDPNEVKVVVDANDNAIYFSREPIPSRKKGAKEVPMLKQVCIIPFRRDYLLKFNAMASTPLEQIESVDMMRIIEHGENVRMVKVDEDTQSVDTQDDLERVESIMENDRLMPCYKQEDTLPANLNIEFWIPETQDNTILKYSNYWNDEEIEKTKAWYVLNGDFEEMENYLKNTGLPADLERSANILKTDFGINLGGTGIDLAAGNLWAAPYLFKMGDIQKLYFLEYSKHRLLKIGPAVLRHYNVPTDRVVLIYGSFYDLHLEDNSVDFVLLSQAFHHADEPYKLLYEIQKVLKKNGVVIIIGEHIIKYHKVDIRNSIKFFISKFMPANLQKAMFNRTFQAPSLFPEQNELFASDPVLGDHFYTLKEYKVMFSKFYFRNFINKKSQFQSFVLVKP